MARNIADSAVAELQAALVESEDEENQILDEVESVTTEPVISDVLGSTTPVSLLQILGCETEESAVAIASSLRAALSLKSGEPLFPIILSRLSSPNVSQILDAVESAHGEVVSKLRAALDEAKEQLEAEQRSRKSLESELSKAQEIFSDLVGRSAITNDLLSRAIEEKAKLALAADGKVDGQVVTGLVELLIESREGEARERLIAALGEVVGVPLRDGTKNSQSLADQFYDFLIREL